MQLFSVAVPPCYTGRRPHRRRNFVSAEGTVVQRGRADEVVQAAAAEVAEFPLTVQLVSVAVPLSCPGRRRCRWQTELPLTVQFVSVLRPMHEVSTRRRTLGGIARAGDFAEFPLTVQFVSVVVPDTASRRRRRRRRSCR